MKIAAAYGLFAAAVVVGGCSRPPTSDVIARPLEPGPRAARDPASTSALYTDVAHAAGIDYRWSITGPRPLNILQTIGNGCAFLDFDNDGNLDILLVGPKLALYKGDGHGHFTDVTHETGLDKLHGHFLGCAVGDYDNDGYDDIYITAYRGGVLLHNEELPDSHYEDTKTRSGHEGGPESGSSAISMAGPQQPSAPRSAAAQRTLSAPGSRRLGVATDGRDPVPPSGGQGANDPTTDTSRRLTPHASHLVRHPSSVTRRFRDVTASAGIASQPWGSSACFVDIDNDGLLDLYVGNYVAFGPRTKQLCDALGVPTACPPRTYEAEVGRVYRNVGGGRFRDVTAPWGFDHVHGKTLAVAAACLAPGGRPTLAVANDAVPGDMLTLRGDTAVNTAAACGTATLGDGVAYGGMSADWGDYDNDGRLDLMIGTFVSQAKAVFHNDGDVFSLESCEKLGMTSCIPRVTFGAKWIDYNNDGWLDLMLANGHIQDNIAAVTMVQDIRSMYRQPTILYRNVAGRRFDDASAGLAGAADRPIVGRGLAIGDYDNDGRMDVLVVDAEGSPLLLHNVVEHAGRWMLIALEGVRCNRDGYGAVVTVHAGSRTLMRHCHADGSYMSSSDKRVHFGLGQADKVDSVTVAWPDGHVDHYANIPVDRIVSIREGARAAAVHGPAHRL